MPVALVNFARTDSGLLASSLNFLNLITANPTEYGLVAGDATSFGTVQGAFAAAMDACTPGSRNQAATNTKNVARTALKNAWQLLANKVNSDASVTDAQKIALGIPPRALPTPIPAPITAPVIETLAVNGWTWQVRLRDASGARRGKAPGTNGAAIFTFVGNNPPTDVGQWTFQANVGRVTSINITFDSSLPAGTRVYATAFWFNNRKESGPAAVPVSTVLQGGSVQAVQLRQAA